MAKDNKGPRVRVARSLGELISMIAQDFHDEVEAAGAVHGRTEFRGPPQQVPKDPNRVCGHLNVQQSYEEAAVLAKQLIDKHCLVGALAVATALNNMVYSANVLSIPASDDEAMAVIDVAIERWNAQGQDQAIAIIENLLDGPHQRADVN